jgi:uncharacterized protein YjiS (DUF1127 family)
MHSSEDHPGSVPAAGLPLPVARVGLTARLRRAVADWQARARSRRLLAEFDEHMRHDIGVDPARVWQETGKWFWRP